MAEWFFVLLLIACLLSVPMLGALLGWFAAGAWGAAIGGLFAGVVLAVMLRSSERGE